MMVKALKMNQTQIEQLERRRSDDTPRRLMITHTIESYWIPSQKNHRSKTETLQSGHEWL